jgi:hypothetical protein
MMKIEDKIMKTIFFGAFAAILVSACGGGGGSEQVAGIDARGNPVAVGVVSKGTITGFGSVILNGVTYNTNSATFTIDGEAGTQSDLAVGDVVVLRGTVNDDGTSPTATSISFDDAVEGPVEAIDLAASTLTVLGQLVHVDADTSFDDNISPASLDGLAVDDIVEVSGFFRADGSIGATRIEAKLAGGVFEVTGRVAGLFGSTFQINDLTVDFSGAQLDDFPGGSPENGQLVEVKGSSFGGGGEFQATRVEYKDNDLNADDGDRMEIEGFITRFVSATDFDVEGVPVTTTGSTIFENGTSADLAINRKVEVEGSVDASGRITATKVELKLSNFIRIEGIVEASTASSVTIFGIVINSDAITRLEDKSDIDLETFTMSDINVGDYLVTRGYEDASGVVAARIEREDFDGKVAIRAFVDSVNDPNFTIRGVSIETNGATVFRDIDNTLIDSGEFFGQAMNRLVEAEGSQSNGGILADEVELED